MIPSTRNLFFPRFTHADCSTCIRKVVWSRSLQRDSGGSSDHDLSVVGSSILYRLAIELSLKIVSLFKAFQLSVGINHSNFKLRLRLSLKSNWYYLQLCKERLPLLTAHCAPAGSYSPLFLFTSVINFSSTLKSVLLISFIIS